MAAGRSATRHSPNGTKKNGRAEHRYPRRFAPGGGVFFAGTYNGHPVGVGAALATIAAIEDGDVHRHTFALAQRAAAGIEAIARELEIPLTVARFGSVFVPYFMKGPITDYTDLPRNDTARDVDFRRAMCEQGSFMAPTALIRNHGSAAHTEADIDRTLETARLVLKRWWRNRGDRTCRLGSAASGQHGGSRPRL